MSRGGETAIVTGAASGIGREIVRRLAADGAIVYATDLASSAIEEVASLPGRITTLPVDVTRREELEAVVARVAGEHGRLDYMFNNAGVAIFGEVEQVTLDEWDTIIDVNLRGVAHGTTIAYAQMLRQGGGRIVNTASLAGLVPVPLQAHYTATKHGVVGLSQSLAIEARSRGVGVTVFCPAFVESGMFVNNTLHGSMAGVDARALVPIRPMPTGRAVEALLRGVDRGARLVVTPHYARAVWWLERVAPRLAFGTYRLALGETRRRASRARRAGG